MRCGAVFLAEATWATKLEIQQAFAIKAYFRFKDDIWILACDRGLARRFISRFRNLAAKVFESELVECSQQSVEMIGVITVIENGNFTQNLVQRIKDLLYQFTVLIQLKFIFGGRQRI